MPPIFAELISDKLSNSSIQDLYTHCRMNLAVDSVNIPAPQFVDLGLLTIKLLYKSASLWTPTNRVGRPTDIAHGSAPDHISENVIAVRDKLSTKSDYSYKTYFKTWRVNQCFELPKKSRSQPPLELTPVGAKTPDPKTLILPIDSSKRKETFRK